MYRKKFIDKLRDKYQSGGARSYYEEDNESYMQTGGVKDMLKFGLKGAKPFLKGAAKRLSGPLGLILGSKTAYAEPVIDESGAIDLLENKNLHLLVKVLLLHGVLILKNKLVECIIKCSNIKKEV